MTLSQYVNKNGYIAGLKAIGKNALAKRLADDEKTVSAILKKEGAISFDRRPARTQKKLTEIQKRKMQAEDLLWDNRDKTVSP